jgi:hypothetical protein
MFQSPPEHEAEKDIPTPGPESVYPLIKPGDSCVQVPVAVSPPRETVIVTQGSQRQSQGGGGSPQQQDGYKPILLPTLISLLPIAASIDIFYFCHLCHPLFGI